MSSLRYDVLVAGGGAAGVAAAAAAARRGARVGLVERCGFLGGMATAAQVGTVCGLYLRDASCAEPTLVTKGFPAEFADRLSRKEDSEPLLVQQGLWVLPSGHLAFARVCQEILAECEVDLLLHATLCGAESSQGRCHAVTALAWNEPLRIEADVFVDCTGEATLAHVAGCETERGQGTQAHALLFRIEGKNLPPDAADLLAARRRIRLAVESGQLPLECERVSFVPSKATPGSLRLKLNVPAGSLEQPAWRDVTQAERRAREWVFALTSFLASGDDAFASCRVAEIAPHLGVRAGRRLAGVERLSGADAREAQTHDDGVARGAWPMERWGEGLRPEMVFFPENKYYEIRLGCLRSKSLENLWAGGRCIAASDFAISSARVIGTALGTGWAAGTAAAFQAAGEPPERAVPLLRRQMSE